MFEKEAEEYIKANNLEWELECYRTSPIGEVEQAFKKGAEFGYNKANEWHYVKDGDLPKRTNCMYSVWFGKRNYGFYNFDGIRLWQVSEDPTAGWCSLSDIIAWKEIVPPKEN